MKTLKVPNRDEARNEGRTKVELVLESVVAPISFMRNPAKRMDMH